MGAGVLLCRPGSDASCVVEPAAQVGATPEPLAPAGQQVNVKIIVKVECWLEPKRHVEMDLARGVESLSGGWRKGSKGRKNIYIYISWEDKNEGPRITSGQRKRCEQILGVILRSTAGCHMGW